MTLWIFGDSFAHPLQQGIEKSWPHLLSLHLKTDLKIRSLSGCANEFIQQAILEHLDQIKENDYVVVVTTQHDRRWFFLDRPDLGIAGHAYNLKDHVGREKANAVRNYYQYLDNDLTNRLFLQAFTAWLDIVQKKFKLNLLVIPSSQCDLMFKLENYKIDGCLYDVSTAEASEPCLENWHKFLEKRKGHDPRQCHICDENHQILAEKIAKTFLNGDNLNLKQGFAKDVLNTLYGD